MKRLELIRSQLKFGSLSNENKGEITIIDNRTGNKVNLMKGKTYNFKLYYGAVKASDLETIKDSKGKVLRSYDPAFMNTISCVK